MNLNLTWSARRRRRDAASPRWRRRGRMGVYVSREVAATVSRQCRSRAGDDHELQQDPVNAVARRPARALAQNCEQLDRLATDMAHCLEDALRMRCASDVEQYEAASLLKRHVVCGDLDAADRLDEDGRRDARADLDRRRREAQENCLGAIQRCEGRFWRAAATGLFFRRRYKAGDAVEVALCDRG